MNDRFKFRAWDPRTNEMFEPSQITFIEAGWSVDKGRGISIPYQPRIILMQSTGLKDKNGKLIFEGDIVKTTQHIDGNFIDCIYEKGQIIYKSFSFQLKPLKPVMYTRSLVLGEDTEIEIIGNIYQDPELLKNKDAESNEGSKST